MGSTWERVGDPTPTLVAAPSPALLATGYTRAKLLFENQASFVF